MCVVRPGFDSTSPAFVRSTSQPGGREQWPACKKNTESGRDCVDTICADVCSSPTSCRLCLLGPVNTLFEIMYIYYRFIVHFPIGLDFLFITFLLHFFRSWTSSLSISSSAISASTLFNHVLLGLLPSTIYSIHFVIQSS